MMITCGRLPPIWYAAGQMCLDPLIPNARKMPNNLQMLCPVLFLPWRRSSPPVSNLHNLIMRDHDSCIVLAHSLLAKI